MRDHELTARLIASRYSLVQDTLILRHQAEAEGGCGVLGMIASTSIASKHVYRSSVQMHNRGNGKGSGLAAVELPPEQMGVSNQIGLIAFEKRATDAASLSPSVSKDQRLFLAIDELVLSQPNRAALAQPATAQLGHNTQSF